MRVRQLHVTRYGPMRPIRCDRFGDFAVVYGANERGKTLLIDALVRMLFKKEIKRSTRIFGTPSRNIDRVTEQPEGFVVLADGEREIKLEADETLSTYFPVAITPRDFRNLFLIRDSDLSVDGESDYYEDIADKLTGVRTSQIEKVARVVQRRGRLKSLSVTSKLANRGDADIPRVADLYRRSRTLADEIALARARLCAEGFDSLEHELLGARQWRIALEEERERHRVAERRRGDLAARQALDELERLRAQLETSPERSSELKRWRELDSELRHLSGELERERRAAEAAAEARRREEEALVDRRRCEREKRARLQRIQADLLAPLNHYQLERLEFRRYEAHTGLYRRVFLALATLAAGFAAACFFTSPPLQIVFAGVAVLAASGALATGIGARRLAVRRALLEESAGELRGNAARHDIHVETVLDLASAIDDVAREVDAAHDATVSREAALKSAVDQVERVAEGLRARIARLDEINGAVAALAAQTECQSLEELADLVDRRESLEYSARARTEQLRGHIPVDVPDEDRMESWRAEIERRLADCPEGTRDPEDVEVDRAEMERVEVEWKRVCERESELAARIAKGTRELAAFETRATTLGILEETPRCRTAEELGILEQRIESWCAKIIDEQNVARKALGVVLEVEREEKEKVEDLFGPSSRVSSLFSTITGGRYSVVQYNSETGELSAETPSGERVPAVALSGGAYDQLYLAIRISIAERIFGEDRGFFVLDDPFLKADSGRLRNMLAMLRSLSEDGWQFIYFTAKDEVVEALRGDIRAGNVQLIELDRVQAPSRRRSGVPTPQPAPVEEPVQRRMEL